MDVSYTEFSELLTDIKNRKEIYNALLADKLEGTDEGKDLWNFEVGLYKGKLEVLKEMEEKLGKLFYNKK